MVDIPIIGDIKNILEKLESGQQIQNATLLKEDSVDDRRKVNNETIYNEKHTELGIKVDNHQDDSEEE